MKPEDVDHLRLEMHRAHIFSTSASSGRNEKARKATEIPENTEPELREIRSFLAQALQNAQFDFRDGPCRPK